MSISLCKWIICTQSWFWQPIIQYVHFGECTYPAAGSPFYKLQQIIKLTIPLKMDLRAQNCMWTETLTSSVSPAVVWPCLDCRRRPGPDWSAQHLPDQGCVGLRSPHRHHRGRGCDLLHRLLRLLRRLEGELLHDHHGASEIHHKFICRNNLAGFCVKWVMSPPPLQFAILLSLVIIIEIAAAIAGYIFRNKVRSAGRCSQTAWR